MRNIKQIMEEFKGNEENTVDESTENVDSAIKALIDAKPSSDNKEQGKFVALMKGLAFSDDPKATKFMSNVMDEIDDDMMDESFNHTDKSKGKLSKLKAFAKQTRKAYEFARNSGYYELEKPATELDTNINSIVDDLEK